MTDIILGRSPCRAALFEWKIWEWTAELRKRWQNDWLWAGQSHFPILFLIYLTPAHYPVLLPGVNHLIFIEISHLCINLKKYNKEKTLVNLYMIENETHFLAGDDSWFTPLGLTTTVKQHLAVIHGFNLRQDKLFAQARVSWLKWHATLTTKDSKPLMVISDGYHREKLLSAEKIYSSILVTIANESKHRKLLESSGIILDDQWHGN